MLSHNNGSEQTVRIWIAVPRRASDPLPHWTAGRIFSILHTFAITYRKNGFSAHYSMLAMAESELVHFRDMSLAVNLRVGGGARWQSRVD